MARGEVLAEQTTVIGAAIDDVGDGLYKGSFTIPEAQAQMLRKALAAPKHVRATEGAGPTTTTSPPRRRWATRSASTSSATRSPSCRR